jgi:hypothetical protein
MLSSDSEPDRHEARQDAIEQFEERFRTIFQRRHDCIHNCDRPKLSPQALKSGEKVLRVIQDIEFLVYRCDAHIHSEFREFLIGIGCTTATMTQAGY